MPSVVPPIENSTMSRAITTAPRAPKRLATWATPLSIAPVCIDIVMKMPIAMTNRKTPAAPNSSPVS